MPRKFKSTPKNEYKLSYQVKGYDIIIGYGEHGRSDINKQIELIRKAHPEAVITLNGETQ